MRNTYIDVVRAVAVWRALGVRAACARRGRVVQVAISGGIASLLAPHFVRG